MNTCPCDSCDENFNDLTSTSEEFSEYIKKLSKKFTRDLVVPRVQDKLANLGELIALCRSALDDSKNENIKEIVANVLWCYVQPELDLAREDLNAL